MVLMEILMLFLYKMLEQYIDIFEGVEPSDLEEMLIGALYIACEDDSYYIDTEVVK